MSTPTKILYVILEHFHRQSWVVLEDTEPKGFITLKIEINRLSETENENFHYCYSVNMMFPLFPKYSISAK